MVAGCVGEFWTKMGAAHVKGMEEWKDGRMEELGIRFGKGLQLVNILRDLPKDLRMGRCYLPVGEPQRLLEPGNFASIKPEYDRWLDMAQAHLDAGWEYTLRLPAGRVRLACVWPIWIGVRTMALLRTGNPLDPAQRIKVTRGEVYRLMLRSLLSNKAALDRHYQRLRCGH
jgi:farnesyl-diphosphate farnesyltransferase